MRGSVESATHVRAVMPAWPLPHGSTVNTQADAPGDILPHLAIASMLARIGGLLPMLRRRANEDARMPRRREAKTHPAGGRGAIKGAMRAFVRQHIPVKLVGSFL